MEKKKEKKKRKKRESEKESILATSNQQPPSQKAVHTLPNNLAEACFFLFCYFFLKYCIQNSTPGPGHGHVCKMFLIKLLEKEYKVLIGLHHHQVWIV